MTWVNAAVALSGGAPSGTAVPGGAAGIDQAEIDALTVHTSGFVNVKDFGAVGNGIADDTAAIQAALTTGSKVFVPAGIYLITAILTMQPYQILEGAGRYKSILRKAFNGDMLNGHSYVVVSRLGFEGVGATYTGRGILFGAGTPQAHLSELRITDFAGYCIEFTAPFAGSQFTLRDSEVFRTTLTNPAIRLPSDGVNANPRHFVNVMTSGGVLVDCNDADNVEIIGGSTRNIVMGTARKVLVTGARIATIGDDFHVSGTDNVVTGCAIAGNVVIDSGTINSTFKANVSTNVVTDNSGNATNYLDIPRTAYTPAFSASGGGAALGNGTLSGYYTRNGKLVTAAIIMVTGSTTTFGTGDLRWTLPFAPTTAQVYVGSAILLNSGTSWYSAASLTRTDANAVNVYYTGSSGVMSGTFPASWAVGSSFRITVTYEM